MNLPSRRNPFNQLARLDPFIDFEDLFRGLIPRSMAQQYERTMDMRLDVNEDDQNYVVNVDMPGVRKEDIDVSVEGNQITIRAEVKRELQQGKGKGKEIYNERYSGQAFRAFTLPSEVDSAKAQAAYDGGVLTLTLPKKATSETRHLSIN